MADNEWIEHESAVSDVWKYFLRSKIKVSRNANRFRAKCKRCDVVMIGKPQRMMKHLISVCKKISFEDRAMIMEKINQAFLLKVLRVVKLQQQSKKSRRVI